MTALALTALLLLCLHETGWRLHRLLPAPMPITAAEKMALGMAAWIGLGGFLNSIDAARPMVLGALAAIALAVAFLRLLRGARQHSLPVRQIADGWPLVPLLLVVVVIAAFAMPTAALNIHDDLRNYLVLPYRMLATGTLAGSALDSVGVDALGGQSFMQGLVLMLIPAGFAPLFDSVVCLLLAGLLLDEMGRWLACPAPLRLVVMLLFVMLDAQAINLSAVYSAAVLVLALLLSTMRVVAGETVSQAAARGAGVRVGLLVAALCTLKMPHALFAMLLLGGMVALLASVRVARRGVMVRAAAGAAGVLLTPWLIVFWRTHGHSVSAWLAGRGVPPVGGDGSALGLLASSSFYYTSPPRDYVWLASCAALCLVIAFGCDRRWRAGGVLLVALLMATVTLVIMSVMVDAPASVRFLAPLLIVVALGCLQHALARLSHLSPRLRASTAVATLLLCIAVLGQRPLARFVAQARAVVEESRVFRVSMNEAERRAMQRALGIEAYDLIRSLQGQVPAGAVVLAPTGLALHLDFARNPVITLHGTALAAPWTPVPADLDAPRLARLLAQLQVDYLLLQDAGIGVLPVAELRLLRETAGVSGVMKRLAAREMAWRDALNAVAAQARQINASPPLRLIALPR